MVAYGAPSAATIPGAKLQIDHRAWMTQAVACVPRNTLYVDYRGGFESNQEGGLLEIAVFDGIYDRIRFIINSRFQPCISLTLHI